MNEEEANMNENDKDIPSGLALACPNCGGAWEFRQIIGEPCAAMKPGPWCLIGLHYDGSGQSAALRGVYERSNYATGMMEQSLGWALRAHDPTTGAYDAGVEFACELLSRIVGRLKPPNE